MAHDCCTTCVYTQHMCAYTGCEYAQYVCFFTVCVYAQYVYTQYRIHVHTQYICICKCTVNVYMHMRMCVCVYIYIYIYIYIIRIYLCIMNEQHTQIERMYICMVSIYTLIYETHICKRDSFQEKNRFQKRLENVCWYEISFFCTWDPFQEKKEKEHFGNVDQYFIFNKHHCVYVCVCMYVCMYEDTFIGALRYIRK